MVAVGRRILPKPEISEEAADCLRLLAGRAHRVYSGVAVVTPKGALRSRLVETRVRFKRLSREDIEAYLACGEWRGKAGGYAIQGFAGTFVVKLVGSYTNVVGLPLTETVRAARRRGLSGALQLDQPGMSAADRHARRRRLARSAASRRWRSIVRSAPRAAPMSTCTAGSAAATRFRQRRKRMRTATPRPWRPIRRGAAEARQGGSSWGRRLFSALRHMDRGGMEQL